MAKHTYTDKLMMTLPSQECIEVDISFLVNGNSACIAIRGPHPIYLEIRADRRAILEMLAEGAKRFEPVSISKAAARAMSMPDEMAQPETAWPWLVRNMPWIFAGIDTSKEPYANYLEGASQSGKIDALAADLEKVKHLGSGARLADIAEVLTGSRQYGGSSLVKRLKAVHKLLTTTTTTPEEAAVVPFDQQKRAA